MDFKKNYLIFNYFIKWRYYTISKKYNNNVRFQVPTLTLKMHFLAWSLSIEFEA